MNDERLFTVARSCLGRRTRKTAALLSRHYAAQLRHTGLSGTEFVLLVTIAQEPDISVVALADKLGLDPTTLVRNVKHASDRRLIAAAGGRGRAGKRLRLTLEGEEALKRALDAWEEVNSALVAKLGPEKVSEGLRFLQALEDLVRA
ncbi:MarR family winged helix-turn-helix transcriptional regulator [Microvirga rosea]|uniref:MarR family winged helix-turn-helix transcriptional regulator n=1 Tax=Microvirga rosea TaxID=2715425 RepID=UPI001D0AD234|nr:MarR family winged helix-turn-helix transcriptional regulator [Microvirga rosea]MCB8819049.1 MarR family winged helix-turn-helix transcriptional regulator [Microvirga rosea]